MRLFVLPCCCWQDWAKYSVATTGFYMIYLILTGFLLQVFFSVVVCFAASLIPLGQHDIMTVYLVQIYFNKVLQIQYSSTYWKYTGYTKKTKEIADGLNQSPALLKREEKNAEKCKSQVSLAFNILSKPGDLTFFLFISSEPRGSTNLANMLANW